MLMAMFAAQKGVLFAEGTLLCDHKKIVTGEKRSFVSKKRLRVYFCGFEDPCRGCLASGVISALVASL